MIVRDAVEEQLLQVECYFCYNPASGHAPFREASPCFELPHFSRVSPCDAPPPLEAAALLVMATSRPATVNAIAQVGPPAEHVLGVDPATQLRIGNKFASKKEVARVVRHYNHDVNRKHRVAQTDHKRLIITCSTIPKRGARKQRALRRQQASAMRLKLESAAANRANLAMVPGAPTDVAAAKTGTQMQAAVVDPELLNEPCPFRVGAASIMEDGVCRWVIRSAHLQHTCTEKQSVKSKRNRSAINAKDLGAIASAVVQVCAGRGTLARTMVNLAKVKGLNVHDSLAYRAREHVLAGGAKKHDFSELEHSLEAIRDTAQAVTHLDVENLGSSRHYLRCFVALGGAVRAVASGCLRPVYALRATAPRGARGRLFVLVSADPDGEAVPLAFAHQSADGQPEWEWFLYHCKAAFPSLAVAQVAMLVDREGGALDVASKVFPHATCVLSLASMGRYVEPTETRSFCPHTLT